MKLNPEVKAKWVAELRSGKHEQGRDALNKGGAMCCLGVLCEISGLHQWKNQSPTIDGAIMYGNGIGMPPPDVCQWAGFEKADHPLSNCFKTPRVTIDGDAAPLDSHNDNGKTFAQIADAIEAQL